MVYLLLSTLQYHSAVLADVVIGLGASSRPCWHASGLFFPIFLPLILGKLVMQHILEGLIHHSQRAMDSLLVNLQLDS